MSEFEDRGNALLEVFDRWGDPEAWGERFTKDLADRSPSERLVFFEGNPQADVVILHEQPSYQDVMTGRSFRDPAHKEIFEEMLDFAGARPRDVFFGPIFPFLLRSPEDGATRSSTATEGRVALDYLADTINIVDPKVIIVLGGKPYNLLRANKTVSYARAAKNMHQARLKVLLPGKFMSVPRDAFVSYDFDYLKNKLDYAKGGPLHQAAQTWLKAFAYVDTLYDLLDREDNDE